MQAPGAHVRKLSARLLDAVCIGCQHRQQRITVLTKCSIGAGAMINLFVGDSHTRQFVGVSFGVFCHWVFSGATVKGLATSSAKVRHSEVLIEQATSGREKQLFVMFGSVDLDFSLQREFCLKNSVDVPAFIGERVDIYASVLRDVLDKARPEALRRIVVVCPQVSPLVGENFFVQTSKHINVAEDVLRVAAQRNDISDRTRANRVFEFNDRLEAATSALDRVNVIRIDRQMVGDDGVILPRFIPAQDYDHHATTSQTQAMWAPHIKEFITDHIFVG